MDTWDAERDRNRGMMLVRNGVFFPSLPSALAQHSGFQRKKKKKKKRIFHEKTTLFGEKALNLFKMTIRFSV